MNSTSTIQSESTPTTSDINELIKQALKQIEQSETLESLDSLKVTYLGKKGHITSQLKKLKNISSEDRPKFGQVINEAKQIIDEKIQQHQKKIQQKLVEQQITKDKIDVTLPGRNENQGGGFHPITQTLQDIESYFSKLGFETAEGPEIEDEFHNFEALNIPEHHPARAMHDTFYFNNGLLLRTHTSPVQIRVMKTQEPPIRIIAPGRVYRCDSDLTHTPMFHQIEGLLIDEKLSFAQLKELINNFLSYFFNKEISTRFRPSYFPFTEPSAEVDIECVNCQGAGCRVCSNTGWLEVLGCGMVHPNVFKAVNIDDKKYTGLAFGLGIERLTMLRYHIDDLRIFFENDWRFTAQFN